VEGKDSNTRQEEMIDTLTLLIVLLIFISAVMGAVITWLILGFKGRIVKPVCRLCVYYKEEPRNCIRHNRYVDRYGSCDDFELDLVYRF